MLNGKLRIQPRLPEAWSQLTFAIYWKSDRLVIKVNKEGFEVEKITSNNPSIEFCYNDKSYMIADRISVKFEYPSN